MNSKIMLDDDDSCTYCGWCCEFPQSHIEHSIYNKCKYISSKYDLCYDSDGEIKATLKTEKKVKKVIK